MAKRSLSDSDCDDLFSDTKDSLMSPPEHCGGGHGVSRKKRRGIIEKRRRDRINNSLTELRRLVPTAFEKQGSAKLEKAEILQMTVDHLKMLHAKGLDALAYDPHKFAMDYHSIGFRECAAEVARYLVTVEGLDIQDPLRLRLMSHLQCFAAQRELANKQASASSWGLNPLGANHSYGFNTNATALTATPPSGLASSQSLMVDPTSPVSSHNQTYLTSNHHSHHHSSPGGMSNELNQSPASGMSHNNNNNSSSNKGFLTSTPTPNYHHHQSAFSSQQHMSASPYSTMNQVNSGYAVQSSKPYRPWGAELAY